MKEPIIFPEAVSIPKECKDLILNLLNRVPEQRFAAKAIKIHTFFTKTLELDWERLEQKDLDVPIRPQIKGGDDSKYFPERFHQDRLESFVAAEPRLEDDVVNRFNYSTI